MISIVTPAHNEEKLIGRCLESIQVAAKKVKIPVEHIVVLNRCTDKTQEICESHGARTVVENARNLSKIRNAGAAAAQGSILITIDADSWVGPDMLKIVVKLLESNQYIGGGVKITPERMSLGIFCSMLVIAPFVFARGWISGGMFWCYKSDFDWIGGFDESKNSVEDVDFALRLKKHGKKMGKKYGTIRDEKLFTSCRKFDQFGDWCFVLKPWLVYKIFDGDKKTVDRFYYDMRSGAQVKNS